MSTLTKWCDRCAGSPLLFGYRGQPAVDVAALEDLLLRVARLADEIPEVSEMDLNPVIVSVTGAVAVDVKIRIRPADAALPAGPPPLAGVTARPTGPRRMAQCFHHPDRETGRACTRCGRPACPDCLIQASVGSQCFECVRAAAPPPAERARRWVAGVSTQPWVTQAIVAGTLVAYLVISLRDHGFGGQGPDLTRPRAVRPGRRQRRLLPPGVRTRSCTTASCTSRSTCSSCTRSGSSSNRRPATCACSSSISSRCSAARPARCCSIRSRSPAARRAACSDSRPRRRSLLSRQGVRFGADDVGPAHRHQLLRSGSSSPTSRSAGTSAASSPALLATEAMLQGRRAGQRWLGLVGVVLVGVAAISVALWAAQR